MCGISLSAATLLTRASIDEGYFDGFAPNRAYASRHLRIRGSSSTDFLLNSCLRCELEPRSRLSIAEILVLLFTFFAVITPIFRSGCSLKRFSLIMNFIFAIWLCEPVDI